MKFFDPSEYQPQAISIFNEIKAKVSLILPEARIEHVGSSAIPGSISKGDLDIFIGVSKDRFSYALEQIQKLNFKIKENTLQTPSLCMLETKQYKMDVAIQLVETGSEFENFVFFRDKLNAQPKLIEAYNLLKTASEKLHAEEYRAKKSQFISQVLKNLKNNNEEQS